MDPLGWLGLRQPRDDTPRLTALINAVRALLPDDESVVVRYIVIVGILLTKVACCDGRVAPSEVAHLEALFRHVDRLPAGDVRDLVRVFNDSVEQLSGSEMKLCFAELKSLCDRGERLQILRLLAQLATADTVIRPAEHTVLAEIAEELDLPPEELDVAEREAAAGRPSAPAPVGEPPATG